MDNALEVKNVSIKYKMFKKCSIKNIKKIFGMNRTEFFEAVKDVSFTVKEGNILGIIGKNGSGKSTLLRAIAKIYSPDSGTIELNGNSVSLLALGVGFEKKLTGRENILLGGMLLGFTENYILKRMDDIIQFADIGDFIDKPVSTYSSGMYSKLAFAITATLETDIILIDEVLSVGDSQFKKKSFARMEELIKDDNKTVIIVSHDLKAIQKLCTEVIWMHEGKIKMYGETGKVIEAYEAFMK